MSPIVPTNPLPILLPMKDLAGIKRHCEIEIRRANRNHIREDNDE